MTDVVLVTGGGGAIGRAVVTALRERDVEVVVASRAQGMTLDVADASAVREAIARVHPQAVVHLAGALPGADAAELERVNVDGTAAVARAAAESGIRLVSASSAAVYGVSNARASHEDDALAPANAYGHSKARAEDALDTAADGATFVSLRIFNVTGPGFPASLPQRLWIAPAEEPVRLRGLDEFVRDYVRAAAVAAVVRAALTAPLPAGHTRLNVGSGVPTSTRHLLDIIGRRRPIHSLDEGGRSDRVWADARRLRDVLGVVPPPLDEGWFTADGPPSVDQ